MAAVMLFQGLFGMAMTQMAIQVTTVDEPRMGELGHGAAFSIKASAHDPATSNTSPRSSKS
jgi:hypothetical protein